MIHIEYISNTYINRFKIFIINPPALCDVYEVYLSQFLFQRLLLYLHQQNILYKYYYSY
mgnify:CR=1 FL=1